MFQKPERLITVRNIYIEVLSFDLSVYGAKLQHQTDLYLQNAIWGRGARGGVITVRQSGDFPALLGTRAVLAIVNCGADFGMRLVVEAALWGQLGELGEEPVAVFEETILMDCVEIIPVLVRPAVVFIWGEK